MGALRLARLLSFFVILPAMALPVLGQSQYTTPGRSSVAAGVGYAPDVEGNVLAGIAGVSFGGRVDAGFSYGTVRVESDGEERAASAMAGSLTLAFRPPADRPVWVGLSATATRMRLDDEFSSPPVFWIPGVGVDVAVNVADFGRVSFQPGVGIGFAMALISASGDRNYLATSLSGNLDVILDLSRSARLAAGPSIVHTGGGVERSVNFGVSGGLVFQFPPLRAPESRRLP